MSIFRGHPLVASLVAAAPMLAQQIPVTERTLSGELDALFEANGVAYDTEAAEKIRAANAG